MMMRSINSLRRSFSSVSYARNSIKSMKYDPSDQVSVSATSSYASTCPHINVKMMAACITPEDLSEVFGHSVSTPSEGLAGHLGLGITEDKNPVLVAGSCWSNNISISKNKIIYLTEDISFTQLSLLPSFLTSWYLLNNILKYKNKTDLSILYIEENNNSTLSLYSLKKLCQLYNINLKIIQNSDKISSNLIQLSKTNEKFDLSITENGNNINNLMRSLKSNGTVCLLNKEIYPTISSNTLSPSIVLGVSRLIFNGMKFYGLAGGVSSLLKEIELEEEYENLLKKKKDNEENSNSSFTTIDNNNNGGCGGCNGGCACTKPPSSLETAIKEVLPLIAEYKVEVKGFPLDKYEEASEYVSKGKQALLIF